MLLLCFIGTVTELTLGCTQLASSTVNKNKNFIPVRNGPDAREKDVDTAKIKMMDSESGSSTERTPLIAPSAANVVEKQKKSRSL